MGRWWNFGKLDFSFCDTVAREVTLQSDSPASLFFLCSSFLSPAVWGLHAAGIHLPPQQSHQCAEASFTPLFHGFNYTFFHSDSLGRSAHVNPFYAFTRRSSSHPVCRTHKEIPRRTVSTLPYLRVATCFWSTSLSAAQKKLSSWHPKFCCTDSDR